MPIPLATDWIYQLFIKETTKKKTKSPEQVKELGDEVINTPPYDNTIT